MDAHRLHYLRALDIDVWVPRGAVEEPIVEAQKSRHETRDSRQENRDARRETRDAQSEDTKRETRDLGHDKSPDSSDRVPRLESRVPLPNLDWPELEAAIKACTKCALHRTRTNAVFGVGNRQAEWMFIGEAPGADEDAQGEPFVGRAGQLLNSMIKAVGMQRSDVFIANILKSRPPNNRDPAPDEVAACIPFLHRQIELVNPKLIVCVGRIAAQNLLNTDTPIGKLRGQVHRLGPRPVVVTYHPAYLLRSPGEKRRAWQDLVLAMNTLKELP
jgi:uracil-DNA glycosylase family 4